MKYFFPLLAGSTLVTSLSPSGRCILPRDHDHHHSGPPNSHDGPDHQPGPPDSKGFLNHGNWHPKNNHNGKDQVQSSDGPTPQNFTSALPTTTVPSVTQDTSILVVTSTPSLAQNTLTHVATVVTLLTRDTSTHMATITSSSVQDSGIKTADVASALTTVFVSAAPTESFSQAAASSDTSVKVSASSDTSARVSASSGRLSPETQLGIGLGVGLGTLAIAAAGILAYMRMRKLRRRTEEDALSSGHRAWPVAPNLPGANDRGSDGAITPIESGARGISREWIASSGRMHFKPEDSQPDYLVEKTSFTKSQEESSPSSTMLRLQESGISPKQIYELGASSPGTSHSVYELEGSSERAENSTVSAKL